MIKYIYHIWEHFAYVNEPTTSATPVGSAIAAINAADLVIYSGDKESVSLFRISTVDFRPAVSLVSFCMATSRPLLIRSLVSASFFN
jgi:hypothetical protein